MTESKESRYDHMVDAIRYAQMLHRAESPRPLTPWQSFKVWLADKLEGWADRLRYDL